MAYRNVTKCICHSRSFEEIKEYAQEHGLSSVEELQDRKYCSCGCGLCSPYVEMVLETGETEFTPGAYYRKKKTS
ncbi:MAG: (2Fe-2S)-binding protein [Balneolaceae bacterium]|nr:(2Fe-2S)-binding protein [Balneolaceae bacterium]